jgi:hypothetical protein
LYNIYVSWRRFRFHKPSEFTVNAREVWNDETGIMFRGYGTRASITSECSQLRAEHPDCDIEWFWTPDTLLNVLEWLGLWRVSEWIFAMCERYSGL